MIEYLVGQKKVAELTNIDLKKFDLLDEVSKSASSYLKVMLPDEEIIGDPFLDRYGNRTR